MWQERQATELKNEIEVVLSCLPGDKDYYELLREPLAKSRRGLDIESPQDRPWPLLPLIVYEAISGEFEKALPVAAALQLLMGAGDVFDDIEDADCSDSLVAKYGSAIATNVATTLIILAEKTVIRLKERGVDNKTIIHIIDTINSYYTTACAGQYLDLSLSSQEDISEDLYLDIINLKSASQIECSCYVGALLATENQELIRKFSLFGQNLGMAAQITNDIQGVITGGDIIRGVTSLPMVYTLSQKGCKYCNQLKQIFERQGAQISDPTPIRNLLFQTGAIHYAMVKMEYYKQQAIEILSDVEKIGVCGERLRVFLE